MAITPVLNSSQNIFESARKTYLSADAAAASTTLTVQSIKEFAINQILCIGELGNEQSEIVKTHASSAPASSTITLVTGGVTFAHSIDEIVYIIPYDQVEFSHATTATGTKTVMSTKDIEADEKETRYNDSTYSTGYYFSRYKNSIDSTYSDYSDAIPVAGYNENTVFSIKDRALEEMGEEISDEITHSWLNQRLWKARRIVYAKQKRWSWMQSFNTDLGDVVAGDYRVAVPTDLQDPNTNKNIMGLRIGNSDNLRYVTKQEIDTAWQGVNQTTLAAAYTVTDATITLTNSRDFPDSGTLQFPDGDTVEYSANVESTGVLTVSTDGSSNHSDEALVYENVSFSMPTRYTVYDGYIYFDYPINEDYEDENYWIDYYKMLTEYDSDADELDEPEFDFYSNYLKWAIKVKKSKGDVGMDDEDYKLFMSGIQDLIGKEESGQEINLVPEVEHLEEYHSFRGV